MLALTLAQALTLGSWAIYGQFFYGQFFFKNIILVLFFIKKLVGARAALAATIVSAVAPLACRAMVGCGIGASRLRQWPG